MSASVLCPTEEDLLAAASEEQLSLQPASAAATPSTETVHRIDDMLQQVLDQREFRLLSLRFGLDGRPPLATGKAGAELGLTAEEAEGLEARALAKLRRPMIRPASPLPIN